MSFRTVYQQVLLLKRQYFMVAFCAIFLLVVLLKLDIWPRGFRKTLWCRPGPSGTSCSYVGAKDPPVVTCTEEDYKDTPFTLMVRNNETVRIPSDPRALDKLSHEEMAALYHRYVENIQYWCKRIVRLGKVKDGGWDVCDDKEFRPAAPCLVYSFGINNDFSFDDAVVNEYGCEVHSFDPSMGVESYQRNKLNYFYNLGLASQTQRTDKGWQLDDIDTIRAKLNHRDRPLSVFKMDIEVWEWDVIPSLLTSGALDHTDNLLVEVHLNLFPHKSTESDRNDYRQALAKLALLYDAGFRIFRTHRNPSNVFVSKCKRIPRVNCHELHMVRVKS